MTPETTLTPTLILAGDLAINPAHIAWVERDVATGYVTVHMAVGSPFREQIGTTTQGRGPAGLANGHPVLTFSGAEATALWAALTGGV